MKTLHFQFIIEKKNHLTGGYHLDALLADLQVVCSQLVPVLSAVALVFLCIFLKKLATLMDTVNRAVTSLDPTLQKVNQSIDKVQAPLDTAVRYSHTLDKVHEKAGDLVDKATGLASEGLARFQSAVKEETGEDLNNNPQTQEESHE